MNNLETQMLAKYVHDIRNLNTLNKEMLNNIRNMSDEKKMEIIIALNDVVDHLKIYFEK